MVEAVTNYIAQRLIEREQVLAADIGTLPRDEERRVALYAPAATAAPVPERCRRRFLVRPWCSSSISSAWQCSLP
jgi:hypothetical protein